MRGERYYLPHIGQLFFRVFATLLLFAVVSFTAVAQQFPINVTVTVLPPYSPELAVWEANPDRVLVNLTNTSAQSRTVRLSGFAESLDGTVRVITKDDFPVPEIVLAAGASVSVNLRTFKLFSPDAVRFTGTDKNTVIKTNRLPEGTYRICVRALDFSTREPLSAAEPSGCATFTIRYVEEPRPISPQCGTTVRAMNPQLVTLQWTVPPGAPAGTEYRVTLTEVPQDQDPEYALRSLTRPILFERTVMTPILTYGPAEPPLFPGKRYAWRVRAVDPSQSVVFRNDGYSAACSFIFGETKPLVGDLKRDPILTPRNLDTGMISLKGFDLERDFTGFVLPACISLKPETSIPLKRLGRELRPTFSVTVEPGINLSAVTGGRLQIWEAPGKKLDRYLGSRRGKNVFDYSFTGNGASNFRITADGRSATTLLLTFINAPGSARTFEPENGTSYVWRFTMNFDGDEIRKDGRSCAADQAASPYGRFPDLVVTRDLPDTLIAGTFTIVVEEWDESSKSDDPSLPSGIGRVKFDCNTEITDFPWWWSGLDLGISQFTVVQAISDSAAQFDVSEARTLEPASVEGDQLQLIMPENRLTRYEKLIDRNLVVDLVKKKSPEGIRVAFRDVRWSGPVKPTVVLTDGIATYPTAPPVPEVPAEISIASGFKLAIDTLTITPSEAVVAGGVLMPGTIVSAESCTYARLELPPTVITSNCKFYRDLPDSTFGPWFVGSTGLNISGTGYVLDFSTTESAVGPMPPLNASWKGVVLRKGGTKAATDPVISNTGYVKAEYQFTEGLVTSTGLAATFRLNAPFSFEALDPYGYRIALNTGELEVLASAIDGGEFKGGDIRLPRRALRKSLGSPLTAQYERMEVQADMDLFASVKMGGPLEWGEFVRDASQPRFYRLEDAADSGFFYLAGRAIDPYYPVQDTNYVTPSVFPAQTQLEALGMQGVTLPYIRNRELTIYTPEMPNQGDPLKFPKETMQAAWMNINAHGVHAELLIRPEPKLMGGHVDMGPIWGSWYQGDSIPFRIMFSAPAGPGVLNEPLTATHYQDPLKLRVIRLQFVESAVWDSELGGTVRLEGPIKTDIAFTNMMFTSTANNAGGQLDLSQPDTLDYWGVEMVAKDTSKSAGVMVVKMGVIYLTAAGFNEPRHFAKPFWLNYGELKASGNMGRLFFDYGNAGQKFDRFGFTPHMVALSPYDPSAPGDSGYVHTYGALAVQFFGAKMMSISDYKSSVTSDPYNGRFVRVRSTPHLGADASELRWQRSWAAGLAELDFTMGYDTIRQDGFIGSGEVGILKISGMMDASLRLDAESGCFNVIESSAHGFAMGPVADFGQVAEIWGCGCIEGGTLKQIAVGGSLSHTAGSTVLQARTATSTTLVFSYRPDRIAMMANGQFFMNVAGSDVEVFGLADLIFDRDGLYAEGYFKGTVNLSQVVGIPIALGASSGISGEGELGWHIGADYQSLQGRVSVSMYGMVGAVGVTVGTGITLETGIFVGVNTPKNKVWVMDGIDGKFGLNKGMLPASLTGFYAYLALKQGIDLFIVSGGYKIYLGIGAFTGIGGGDLASGVIGNLGIEIWGKILGGLVSASAWGNLQMVAGIPPAFHGAVGLEACVLFIFCGEVSVNVGFNVNDGFYLY